MLQNRVDRQRAIRVTIPIYGLGCGGGGSLAVEHAIKKVAGVKNAYVNPATEMAYVEYDSDAADPGQLVGAVRSAGFQAGQASLR